VERVQPALSISILEDDVDRSRARCAAELTTQAVGWCERPLDDPRLAAVIAAITGR